MNRLGPDELAQSFETALGDAVLGTYKQEREVGAQRHVYISVWVDIKPEALRAAVQHVSELERMPHFSVISSADLGDTVEMCYHFSLYFGQRRSAIALVLKLVLDKSNLSVPTITDLVPGAIFSEREQLEMMGVQVEGIPDDRRLFVADSFPEGVFPWRRDETGPHEMLRVLGGRQGIQHE
jgi:membrane-bound hydrogenase subunit beta